MNHKTSYESYKIQGISTHTYLWLNSYLVREIFQRPKILNPRITYKSYKLTINLIAYCTPRVVLLENNPLLSVRHEAVEA